MGNMVFGLNGLLREAEAQIDTGFQLYGFCQTDAFDLTQLFQGRIGQLRQTAEPADDFLGQF